MSSRSTWQALVQRVLMRTRNREWAFAESLAEEVRMRLDMMPPMGVLRRLSLVLSLLQTLATRLLDDHRTWGASIDIYRSCRRPRSDRR
jgi:hypothetical protein